MSQKDMGRRGTFLGGYFPSEITEWVNKLARSHSLTTTKVVKSALDRAMKDIHFQPISTAKEVLREADARSKRKLKN